LSKRFTLDVMGRDNKDNRILDGLLAALCEVFRQMGLIAVYSEEDIVD